MVPRFETISPQTLVGQRLTMPFAHDRTAALWRSFRMQQRSLPNTASTDFLSVNVYGPAFDFGPTMPFEKWATMEATDFEVIPDGLEAFTLPGGLYAVFSHRGPASDGPAVFGYIFGTWLPASGYAPDDRPHFEVPGPAYRPDGGGNPLHSRPTERLTSRCSFKAGASHRLKGSFCENPSEASAKICEKPCIVPTENLNPFDEKNPGSEGTANPKPRLFLRGVPLPHDRQKTPPTRRAHPGDVHRIAPVQPRLQHFRGRSAP